MLFIALLTIYCIIYGYSMVCDSSVDTQPTGFTSVSYVFSCFHMFSHVNAALVQVFTVGNMPLVAEVWTDKDSVGR